MDLQHLKTKLAELETLRQGQAERLAKAREEVQFAQMSLERIEGARQVCEQLRIEAEAVEVNPESVEVVPEGFDPSEAVLKNGECAETVPSELNTEGYPGYRPYDPARDG